MKSLDTNILARFFVNDPEDVEAARERPAAASALSERAFVPVTVLLEFEWVLRGFYAFPTAEIARVFRALASLENVDLRSATCQTRERDCDDARRGIADLTKLVGGAIDRLARIYNAIELRLLPDWLPIILTLKSSLSTIRLPAQAMRATTTNSWPTLGP